MAVASRPKGKGPLRLSRSKSGKPLPEPRRGEDGIWRLAWGAVAPAAPGRAPSRFLGPVDVRWGSGEERGRRTWDFAA